MTKPTIKQPLNSMRATFAEQGKYRYLLSMRWASSGPMLVWCLLNPSKAGQVGAAGAPMTDPTWTKAQRISTRLGYAGQVFCNAYALVSTDPKGLLCADDLVGPFGNDYLLHAARMGDGNVLCAWGVPHFNAASARFAVVAGLLQANGYKLKVLAFTKDGHPRHPLYLAYRDATELKEFA